MARSRFPVFLLDARVGPVPETDLARIHQVVLHTVARLVADGTSIRYTHGLFIPDQGQCLCLFEAADLASVVRAGDIAGFPLAHVRPAVDLTAL